jgi:hypothetical protein
VAVEQRVTVQTDQLMDLKRRKGAVRQVFDQIAFVIEAFDRTQEFEVRVALKREHRRPIRGHNHQIDVTLLSGLSAQATRPIEGTTEQMFCRPSPCVMDHPGAVRQFNSEPLTADRPGSVAIQHWPIA